MKRVIFTAFLLESSKSLTLWKQIGDEDFLAISMAVAGPNQGYVVQGEIDKFKVYQMDFGSNLSPVTNSLKDITLPANPNIVHLSTSQSESGFNLVGSTLTIFRFNAEPGQPVNFEEYSVETTGKVYSLPYWADQTNYMFISTRDFANPHRRLYRVHSDHTNDVKIFNTGDNSRTYGLLSGTNWLVVSLYNVGVRLIFDYTNGHADGTNSVVGIHVKKDSIPQEVGFISPEDGRGYYVVGIDSIVNSDKKVYTVKNDGAHLLKHDLPTINHALD